MDWQQQQQQQQAGDSIREPPFWTGSTGHPWVLLHGQTRIIWMFSSPLISSHLHSHLPSLSLSLSLSLCVS